MSRLNPTHPGDTIREDCVEALGLTIAEAAEQPPDRRRDAGRDLRMPRPNHRRYGNPVRDGVRSTADHWLRRQAAHDLAQARKGACDIKRIERAA